MGDAMGDAGPALAKALRGRSTDAERRLWLYLRNRQLGGFKFRRQHPIGRYVVDFVCPDAMLVVEVDGGQHDWQAADDRAREAELALAGYRVLRFWNNDVLADTEGVLTRILLDLEAGTEHQAR